MNSVPLAKAKDSDDGEVAAQAETRSQGEESDEAELHWSLHRLQRGVVDVHIPRPVGGVDHSFLARHARLPET